MSAPFSSAASLVAAMNALPKDATPHLLTAGEQRRWTRYYLDGTVYRSTPDVLQLRQVRPVPGGNNQYALFGNDGGIYTFEEVPAAGVEEALRVWSDSTPGTPRFLGEGLPNEGWVLLKAEGTLITDAEGGGLSIVDTTGTTWNFSQVWLTGAAGPFAGFDSTDYSDSYGLQGNTVGAGYTAQWTVTSTPAAGLSADGQPYPGGLTFADDTDPASLATLIPNPEAGVDVPGVYTLNWTWYGPNTYTDSVDITLWGSTAWAGAPYYIPTGATTGPWPLTGNPVNPASSGATTGWTWIAGPTSATATIAQPGATATTAVLSAYGGTYTFRYTHFDNMGGTSTATVDYFYGGRPLAGPDLTYYANVGTLDASNSPVEPGWTAGWVLTSAPTSGLTGGVPYAGVINFNPALPGATADLDKSKPGNGTPIPGTYTLDWTWYGPTGTTVTDSVELTLWGDNPWAGATYHGLTAGFTGPFPLTGNLTWGAGTTYGWEVDKLTPGIAVTSLVNPGSHTGAAFTTNGVAGDVDMRWNWYDSKGATSAVVRYHIP